MTDPESYNSLADPNLNTYFQNKRILKHLRKAGLINRHGEIVSPKSYELVLERRSRRRQAREELSKNIVDYVLEKEKEYQAFVRSQFERAAKHTKIRKIQKSKRRQPAVAGDLVAVDRPKTAVVHSRPTSKKRSPVRVTSARQSTRDTSAHQAAHTKSNFVRRSVPEKIKYEKRCQVTMIYYGPQMIIDHDSSWFQPYGDEIVIMQQHCGGENLIVFKGFRVPNNTFTFESKRHPDFPFALALYVNGLIDSRISVCCEYKHKLGVRLGGKQGQFGITDVKRRTPCRSCRFEQIYKKKVPVERKPIVIDPSQYRSPVVRRTPLAIVSDSPVLLRTPSPHNKEKEKPPVVKSRPLAPVPVLHSSKSLRSSPTPSPVPPKPASPPVNRSDSDELDEDVRSSPSPLPEHEQNQQHEPVISSDKKRQPDYDGLSLSRTSLSTNSDVSPTRIPINKAEHNRPSSPSLSETSSRHNQNDLSQTPIRQVSDGSSSSSSHTGRRNTDDQERRHTISDSSNSTTTSEDENSNEELEIPFEPKTSSDDDDDEGEAENRFEHQHQAQSNSDDLSPFTEADEPEKPIEEPPTPERETVASKPQKTLTRRHRPLENLVLIWLDAMSENMDGDAPNTRAQLRCVVHTLKTFSDAQKCVKFIQDNKNEKILLVISGTFSQEIVPLVEAQPQLVGVYILCENVSKYKQWVNQNAKVKDAFNDSREMCKRLKIDSKQWNNDLNTFTSIPSATDDDKSNQQNSSFVYTQLFKEILIEMEYEADGKEKFIEFCKALCSKNPEELSDIEEFERKYQDHTPVWWYTTDCLAYQILNRAIRTQDIPNILEAGFFLRDLHKQLTEIHSLSSDTRSFTVYRGQGMEQQSFEELQKNQGGLLSFNGFLSTSTEKKIALEFAQRSVSGGMPIAVLFQMEIEPKMASSPFASVGNESRFGESEHEILFSMPTVFRIGELKQINEKLWQVSLTLISNDDNELQRLIEPVRQSMTDLTGNEKLGKLLIMMGKYDQAEYSYGNILATLSDTDYPKLADVQNQLALISAKLGHKIHALFYYKQSLKNKLQFTSSDDKSLADSYNDMGTIQHELERFPEALDNYQQALNILEKHLPSSRLLLAKTYGLMAATHVAQNNNSKALECYKKQLEIEEKMLQRHDPGVATTHFNIAMNLKDPDQREEAIHHAQHSVDISRRNYSSDHPELQKRQAFLEEIRAVHHSNTTDD